VAQGAIFSFFGLSTCIFWLAMAVELHSKIVLRSKDADKYTHYWIGAGWTLPMLPLIALAGGEGSWTQFEGLQAPGNSIWSRSLLTAVFHQRPLVFAPIMAQPV
jgi:hypothetical protein